MNKSIHDMTTYEILHKEAIDTIKVYEAQIPIYTKIIELLEKWDGKQINIRFIKHLNSYFTNKHNIWLNTNYDTWSIDIIPNKKYDYRFEIYLDNTNLSKNNRRFNFKQFKIGTGYTRLELFQEDLRVVKKSLTCLPDLAKQWDTAVKSLNSAKDNILKTKLYSALANLKNKDYIR